MSAYIEDLFQYLDRFETRAAEFDTEAFLQTYSGVYALFGVLREQRDKAFETDSFFLERIQHINLTKSDLRLLTIQLLITYFESEADVDGQSNRSYLYCRGLREVKQDITYFENHLVPLLFAEGSLNWNFRLNAFFLNEIARYMNKFGKRFETEISPEAFDALAEPAKFLVLARRRLALGEELLKDRGSLEFHLQRIDAFSKLGSRGRAQAEYLSDWGYLSTAGFLSKVRMWLTEFTGKLSGAFSSSRYFRLIMMQRNPAYLFYSAFIIICVLMTIYITSLWNTYSGEKLQQFEQHAQELRSGGKR